MRDFRKYEVWHLGIEVCKLIYLLVNKLPDIEKFNLKTQSCRSALSIPSNIAEGCSRSSEKDFSRFVEIAIGSSFEIETQLLLSIELKYFKSKELKELLSKLNHLQKKLNALRTKLRK